MCAVSRLILPAILAGMVAGTLANQPLVGWAVGAAVAASLYLVGRRRGGASCALPPRPAGQAAAVSDVETGTDGEPLRKVASR